MRRRQLRRWLNARQPSIFCECGGAAPETRIGLCKPCYRGHWRDRRFFGGNRREVLERDRRQCQLCGGDQVLNVHHRLPSQHESEYLLTLCAGCHVRIHRLRAIRRWMPAKVIALWAEVHLGQPVQLQLWDE